MFSDNLSIFSHFTLQSELQIFFLICTAFFYNRAEKGQSSRLFLSSRAEKGQYDRLFFRPMLKNADLQTLETNPCRKKNLHGSKKICMA